MTWTAQRVAILRELHAEGVTFSEIAAEINGQTKAAFSRNAVIGKATRLGLTGAMPRPHGGYPEHRARRLPRTSMLLETPKAKRERKPDGSLKPDVSIMRQYDDALPPSEFLGIALLDLKPGQCRYPRGDGIATLFCGQPQKDGSSYCESCHARCHNGMAYTEHNISPEGRERMRQGMLRYWQRKRAA